ncbi:ribosome silencing factor [Fictibacillus phosphorivorans]|uniref:ribosome silencing factor n=1 Tax=Fictibacillus phosphorivorans TaxID=1221500 RepID=UPI00203E9C48|nr:ribosome silencing factor [Fictibacillus phosphorivorans]MCM3716900.1 ribosome silencing factor [Fictibacillus phosphorivorans]MCM3774551.1 ribosome silencing factor [Fictibacillus phosphorivorans]
MNVKSLMELVVKTADDKRAENITVLDMEGISLVADYFVICHGNSEKQVQAISKELKDVALENNIQLRRMEGYDHARWVLIDLGNVVVHVFHRDDRGYYNLEKLWGDANTVDVEAILAPQENM